MPAMDFVRYDFKTISFLVPANVTIRKRKPMSDNFQDGKPSQEAHEAYKLLAREHHPDKDGGSLEAMQAVNTLYDVVKEAAADDFDKSQPYYPQADVEVDADDPFQEPESGPADASPDICDDPFVDEQGIIFPHEASARIRAMSVEERTAWDADRARVMTDPIYLSGVLGMDLQLDPHVVLFHELL